jgi:hypothetical protein
MPKGIDSAYSHWPSLNQRQFNTLMLEFGRYCSEGSMIINKNGQSVPFVLNEAQKLVAEYLINEIFADVPSPTNLFIHKSRQMGISVVIAKIEQFMCSRKKFLNTQHIMPTEPYADDLCDKKFVPLLQGTHPTLLPSVHQVKRRVKFLEFGQTKLDSSVAFSSAQQHGGGRSQTNQVVIEDEQAFYERADYLEKGMLATMPKAGLSLRVVVSTAYGMNHFYDLSKVAQTSQYWKYLFLPWHMLAEYEMAPWGSLQQLNSLTDYQVKLCTIFEEAGYPAASWARKLQWYQYVLETEAKLDWDYMYENFPSTAEESFAASGAPVLPAQKLRDLRDHPQPFSYAEITQDVTGTTNISDTALSSMKRFAKPQPGRKYLIGADPADGGADGDASAAVVIDLTTMEAVCCVKERIDQNEFAELLNHLGRYYNNASIVPERNTGQSLIDWLVMLKYPNMFIDALHTTHSRVVYGIYMTRPVKNEAILRLKFLLNKAIYTDYDPDFLEEGLHFTWKKTPSGLQKAMGTEGFGDDCVLARLIAAAALNMSRWRDYNNYGSQEQTDG